MVFIKVGKIMNEKEEKRVSKSNVEYINKKGKKINQKPKNTKFIEKPDKTDIRNMIWIIILFIILFVVLIMLPYMSNYR